MADAFECARCGSDRADPRRFSRHGSAIDEAYCDGCWPIVAGELSGSSSEIDPEKMKWVHEVMEGEEDGFHPGDSDGRVAALDNPPHMINMTGLDSDGVSRRLGTPDRMAALDMVEAIEEDPNLDPNDVMDERWKPTNFGTPLRSHKDTSPYFGGKRSPQAIEALGDKNIDFRASEDPFDYAWDMIVKMPWFHHATPSSNRNKIFMEGIKPGIDGLVYASKNPELAARWMMFTNRHAPEVSVLPFWREKDDPAMAPGVDHSPTMIDMLMGDEHEHSDGDVVTFDETIGRSEILPNLTAEGTPNDEDRSAGNPGATIWQNPFYDPQFQQLMEEVAARNKTILDELDEKTE